MATFRFTLLFRIGLIFLVVGISGCSKIKPTNKDKTIKSIALLPGTKNVWFVPTEYILDTNSVEKGAHRNYLRNNGFRLRNDCNCPLPFEIWYNPNSTPQDVGTVVSSNSPSGQPRGGLIPNLIIFKRPHPIDKFSTEEPDLNNSNSIILNANCLGFSNQINISVLDSGIDPSFSYRGRSVLNWTYNGSNACPNNSNQYGIHLPRSGNYYGEPLDSIGHGCSVNSIILGVSNYVIISKNLNIKTNSVSIFNRTDTSCTLMDFLCGLNYSIAQNPKIVNLSLGFRMEINSGLLKMLDSTLRHDIRYFINEAKRKNIVVVAAMGNDSVLLNEKTKVYPAYLASEFENLISVGANLLSDNNLTDFTNYADLIHMTTTAPGDGIIANYPKYLQRRSEGTGYAQMSGTSFSTPFVTRLAAILLAKHPNDNPAQIKGKILNECSRMRLITQNGNTIQYRVIKPLNELRSYICGLPH